MDAVFLFSFNRAEFLTNCVRSLEDCMPNVPICVIDDGSDDPATVSRLGEIGRTHQLIANAYGSSSEYKTGGLSGAMNLAMEIARTRGFETVLFIQDDMQMVRRYKPRDQTDISSYFDTIPNTFQISTNFIRRLDFDSFRQNYEAVSSGACYIRREHTERGKSGFSATGVFRVSRFADLFGTFEVGEGRNSDKAISLGLKCGRSIFPFMCWLPYPTSFRGKKRTIKHRFFEHFGKSGYHPISYMAPDAVERLHRRDPRELPVMEEFLTCPSAPRHDIWSTGGGEYNFLAYGSMTSKIFRLARRLKAHWTGNR